MAGQKPEFRLSVEPGQERVVVRVFGEIDIATADYVGNRLTELVESGYTELIADLREVTFIDSTGIRMLITSYNRAKQVGSKVSIVVGGGETRRILEMTGLLDHLEIEGIVAQEEPSPPHQP